MKLSIPRLLLAALAVAALSACSEDDNGDNGGNGTGDENGRQAAEIHIGALLPLTGAIASYGEASQAALTEAQDRINAENSEKLALTIVDTGSDPQTALAKLRELASSGIKLVIGPYSSAEVEVVKPFADQNGIVLISPLSTANTLAIPNDNLYRFTPDDRANGIAVAALAYADGVRTVIPISRDDEGNLGLQAGFKAAFEALGGRIGPGLTYAANETNFVPVVMELANILEEQVPASTAVYLTAFGEVTDLFRTAADSPSAAVLKRFEWYGSDSVALSEGLVQDAKAAAFAVNVIYPNPILGLRDEDESLWKPVSDKLAAKLGRTPDSFALAAYDGLMVGYAALKAAGPDAAAADLGRQIVTIAATHRGLTGLTTLNEAGDRSSGNYDFWSVCPEGSGYTWVRTATYIAATASSPAHTAHPRSC